MNLYEAYLKMNEGHKVKLPEWTGYWFMVPVSEADPHADYAARTRVFTKNGDILDKPWIDKVGAREDFEITDGALGFDFAILALKNGKTVERKGWNGSGMFIFKIEGSKLADKLGYGYGEVVGEPTITDTFCIKTAQNTLVMGWKPTIPDMLAMDWRLAHAPQIQ